MAVENRLPPAWDMRVLRRIEFRTVSSRTFFSWSGKYSARLLEINSLGGRCPKKLRSRFVFVRPSRGLVPEPGGLPVTEGVVSVDRGRVKEVGRSPKKPSSLLVLVRPKAVEVEGSLGAMVLGLWRRDFSCTWSACSFAIAWARRSSAPPGVWLRFVRMRRSRSGIVGSWQNCSNSASDRR